MGGRSPSPELSGLYEKLVRIEIVDDERYLPVALYYACPGGAIRTYRLTYQAAWRGLVTDPLKLGSIRLHRPGLSWAEEIMASNALLRPLGADPQQDRLLRDSGRPGSGGGREIWGWEVSLDFWRAAVEQVRQRLG